MGDEMTPAEESRLLSMEEAKAEEPADVMPVQVSAEEVADDGERS